MNSLKICLSAIINLKRSTTRFNMLIQIGWLACSLCFVTALYNSPFTTFVAAGVKNSATINSNILEDSNLSPVCA